MFKVSDCHNRMLTRLLVVLGLLLAAVPAHSESSRFDVSTGILRIPVLNVPGVGIYYVELLDSGNLVFQIRAAEALTLQASLAGTWKVVTGSAPDGGNEIYFIFEEGGRFVYIEGDGETPNGAEGGTYVFNESTGVISFARIYDYINPDGGLFENSSPASASATATISGDTLTLNMGNAGVAFQRL